MLKTVPNSPASRKQARRLPATGLAVFLLMCMLIGPAHAETENPAFKPGQRLVYEVRWGPFKVAHASMTTSGPLHMEEQLAYAFSLNIETNSFADNFYRMRDTYTGYTDPTLSRSLLYLKRENHKNRERNVDVRFDWQQNTVQYSREGHDSREPITLDGDFFDPVSTLFIARMSEIVPGESLIINVADGRTATPVTLEVGKPTNIRTKAGNYEAVLIKPDLSALSDEFDQKKNSLHFAKIWVSNDEQKLPVQLSIRVNVGSIKAKLIAIEDVSDNELSLHSAFTSATP